MRGEVPCGCSVRWGVGEGGAGRVACGWTWTWGTRANADAGCTNRYDAATGFVMLRGGDAFCALGLGAVRVGEGEDEDVPLRA